MARKAEKRIKLTNDELMEFGKEFVELGKLDGYSTALIAVRDWVAAHRMKAAKHALDGATPGGAAYRSMLATQAFVEFLLLAPTNKPKDKPKAGEAEGKTEEILRSIQSADQIYAAHLRQESSSR